MNDVNKGLEKQALLYAVWQDFCEFGYEYTATFEDYLLLERDKLAGDGNYKDAELLGV